MAQEQGGVPLPQILALGLGGAQGGGFSRGFQRGLQMLEQQKQRQQQQEFRQEDLDLRRSANDRAEQQSRLQAVNTIRQLLEDETLDTPEAFSQRMSFATGMAPQLGIEPGFIQKTFTPEPSVFQKRRAKKRLAELAKAYSAQQLQQMEAGATFEMPGEVDPAGRPLKLSLAQLRERAGVGAQAPEGQPFQFAQKAAPNDAPLDRQYLEAVRRGDTVEAQRILEAIKATRTVDDRPRDEPLMTVTEIDPVTGEQVTSVVPRKPGEVSRRPPPDANQAQTTAGTYATRVEQAEHTLTQLQPAIQGMNLLSFTAQLKLPAAAQSAEMQSYMQAARNFVNALLRRESGAVISPSEFAEARQQYLPQPGDTNEVLQQKALNRRIVFDGLKMAAGRAYAPLPRHGGDGAGGDSGPRDGDERPIPGIRGGVAVYRKGRWIRKK